MHWDDQYSALGLDAKDAEEKAISGTFGRELLGKAKIQTCGIHYTVRDLHLQWVGFHLLYVMSTHQVQDVQVF